MEFLELTDVYGYKHWVNVLKITRVTIATPAVQQQGNNPVNMNLALHLDTGFSIEVTDVAQVIIDKLDKMG